MRLIVLGGAWMLGSFTCFYAAMLTIDRTFWIGVCVFWSVCCFVYGYMLKRIGRRGGYFQAILNRRVREQISYRRSARPNAPLTRIPDHTES